MSEILIHVRVDGVEDWVTLDRLDQLRAAQLRPFQLTWDDSHGYKLAGDLAVDDGVTVDGIDLQQLARNVAELEKRFAPISTDQLLDSLVENLQEGPPPLRPESPQAH